MKLVFIVPAMNPGGTERVVSILANRFSERHSVSIVTWQKSGYQPFYTLHSGITLFNMNLLAEPWTLWQRGKTSLKRVMALRKVLHRIEADAAISFGDETNTMVLMALIGLRIPIVIASRSDPTRYPFHPLRRVLRRLVYHRAKCLVVQTHAAATYYKFLNKAKVEVIPNPIVFQTPTAISVPFPRPFILTVGRLSHEKGHDLLIRAFAAIHRDFKEWHLVVVGSGPQRDLYQQMVRGLHLDGRVHFAGILKEVFDYYLSSALFVLPSRFEGFPNALCEAMSCGLPVIASDIDGVREIIKDGKNGLLFQSEDIGSLEDALARLLKSPDDRRRLGAEARASANTYDVDIITARWEALLHDL